jgi:hypothetical protein
VAHRTFFVVVIVALGLTLAAFVACTEDTTSSTPTNGDASSSSTPDGASSSGEDDSGGTTNPKDDSGTSSSGSLTPTMKTALTATINTVERLLDRSQWGSTAIDGGTGIYLEAHRGGDPACPTSSSPTPDYTLIVANIPRGAVGAKYTMADGVRVAYFDFKGDQVTDGGGNPIVRATSAMVTIVAIDSAAQGSVEVEVDATFPSGTVKGRAYATFCQSLSD